MEKCSQLPEVILKWIDLINSKNLHTLQKYMTATHTFFVEGESPTVGVTKNCRAWQGYFSSFPKYRIYVDSCYYNGEGSYYLLGHTNGSHVSDELESVPESVIWKTTINGGLIDQWIIYEGDRRQSLGIPNGT